MFIRFCLAAIAAFVPVLVPVNIARADGLIYRLPPDGTWVRYRVTQHATEIASLDGKPLPDMSVEATLTLRSVGQVATDGHKSRWIELEWKIPPAEDRRGRIIVLKMSIPEDELQVWAGGATRWRVSMNCTSGTATGNGKRNRTRALNGS